MLDDTALIGTAAGRALLLAAALLLAGAATCTLIAPARAIARAVRTGALLLLAAIVVQTFGQLLAFEAWASDAAPLRDTLVMIGNTNWGHTRLAVVCIAAASIAISYTRTPILDLGVRGVAISLVLVLPLLGHAASSSNVPLAYLLGVAHTAGAAMWLGSLALLAPTWWTGVQSTIVMLPAYGRLAMFAAPVVVASGVLTVWTRFESPTQLFSTTYGRLVLAKTAVVSIILVIGARHHRALTGRTPVASSGASLQRSEGSRKTLRLELLLAALVLAVTGWLGESEPPTLE